MGTSHGDQNTFIISRSIFLKTRNVSDKSFRLKSKQTFYAQNIFCRKSCLLRDSFERSSTTRQATGKNMAQTHFMPITLDHKRILRICYTYCFSNATMFLRKPLCITFIPTLPLSLAMTLVITNKCLWSHNHECHSFYVTTLQYYIWKIWLTK